MCIVLLASIVHSNDENEIANNGVQISIGMCAVVVK